MDHGGIVEAEAERSDPGQAQHQPRGLAATRNAAGKLERQHRRCEVRIWPGILLTSTEHPPPQPPGMGQVLLISGDLCRDDVELDHGADSMAKGKVGARCPFVAAAAEDPKDRGRGRVDGCSRFG